MKLFGSSLNMGGVALGAGVVLLAPVVIPVIGAVLKPLAKAMIKGGIVAYESAKLSIAETKEMVEDLAAEAKAEIGQKPSQE